MGSRQIFDMTRLSVLLEADREMLLSLLETLLSEMDHAGVTEGARCVEGHVELSKAAPS